MSKSAAGIVNSNSSVPCFRSSAQMPIVMVGMYTSMMNGNQKLSWSRLARLLPKKSGTQKAAIVLEKYEQTDEHVTRRTGEVTDEVTPENGH